MRFLALAALLLLLAFLAASEFAQIRKHEEAALKIRRDFMGVAPEELHQPSLFLAWKAPGSTLHWERWEALR